MDKETLKKFKEMLDDELNKALKETKGEMNIKVDEDGVSISWMGNNPGLVAAANGAIETLMKDSNNDFDEAIAVIKAFRELTSTTISEVDRKEFRSKEEAEAYREMVKKSPEERDSLKKQLEK